MSKLETAVLEYQQSLQERAKNATQRSEATQASIANEFVSERLLAQRLASGNLHSELRYMSEGPEQGWRRRVGCIWVPAPEPVPLPLSAAVHIEAGALINALVLDNKVARAMESTYSMKAILAQLQAHSSMRFATTQTDPPYYLATPVGVLDFKAGRMLPPNPDGPAFLHGTAIAYDPVADHPLWTAVARHVASLPLGEVVHRYLGASLLGIPPDRKLLFLVGDGGDGKGTLLRSCVAAMGGFGSVLPVEALSGDGRGAHGNELLSGLATARLAYASEVPPNLDWPLMKATSGGDPRTSKRMHSRSYTVQGRAWLALATNTAPRPPDQAAADRCIIIPWSKPEESDPDIVTILATPGADRDAYLRACLRWMVEGAAKYLADGLGVPDFARAKVEPEGLSAWLLEEMTAGNLTVGHGQTPLQPFADAAGRWHIDHGMETPTTTALGTFLRSRMASRRIQKDGHKITIYGASFVDRVGHG